MVKSSINPKVEYKETADIEPDDLKYESFPYSIIFDSIDPDNPVQVVFGQLQTLYENDGVSHFPMYFLNNKNIASKIGVLEIEKLKKLDTLRNTTDTKKMDTLRNSPDTRKLVTLRNTVPWIGKSENLLETEGIRCLWQLGKNYLRNSPSLIYSISSIEKERGEYSTELHPAHTVRLKDSVTRSPPHPPPYYY